MKYTYLIFTGLIVLLLNMNILAQNDKIQAIKKHYYNLSSEIEKCENESLADCSLYKNELIINPVGKSACGWPAVGNYLKKITFWYDAAPAHWDGDGKKALQKIIIEETAAVRNYYYEYVYKNGKLIFSFAKEDNGGESRYYYENGNLIKFIEKPNGDRLEFTKEYSGHIIKDAEKLQSFFITMFL